MAMINTRPYIFEDRAEREFTVFDQDHAITDVLNWLIDEVGLDEVQDVLAILVEEALLAEDYR